MASSINRRRAFSQIQNTISKSKSTTTRIGENNIVGKEDIVGRLNLDDENASVVSKNLEKRKDVLIEEEPIRARVIRDKPAETNEKKMEENSGGLDIAAGGNVDLDDSCDSIETYSKHIDCPPLDYDYDDILPPDERMSNIDPRFWNRFLMPSLSPPEFDNKENIWLQCFEDEEDGNPNEWEEMECALAKLELQKLTLLRK